MIDVVEELGEIVKAARTRRRLSVARAAEQGGISPTAWRNLEAGRVGTPTVDSQDAVAAALSWPTTWLDDLRAGVSVHDLDERGASTAIARGGNLTDSPAAPELIKQLVAAVAEQTTMLQELLTEVAALRDAVKSTRAPDGRKRAAQ